MVNFFEHEKIRKRVREDRDLFKYKSKSIRKLKQINSPDKPCKNILFIRITLIKINILLNTKLISFQFMNSYDCFLNYESQLCRPVDYVCSIKKKHSTPNEAHCLLTML